MKFIIIEPKDDNHNRGHKYPFLSSEILNCDISKILDYFLTFGNYNNESNISANSKDKFDEILDECVNYDRGALTKENSVEVFGKNSDLPIDFNKISEISSEKVIENSEAKIEENNENPATTESQDNKENTENQENKENTNTESHENKKNTAESQENKENTKTPKVVESDLEVKDQENTDNKTTDIKTEIEDAKSVEINIGDIISDVKSNVEDFFEKPGPNPFDSLEMKISNVNRVNKIL